MNAKSFKKEYIGVRIDLYAGLQKLSIMVKTPQFKALHADCWMTESAHRPDKLGLWNKS